MDINFKQWKFKILAYLSIALLATASSGGSLFGDFVFDDTEAIVNNKDVTGENDWPKVFENDFWGTKLIHNQSHKSYRPLTVLTFRFNFWLFGRLVPWSFHVVNILLHIIVCILLWRVYVNMIGEEKSLTGLWACYLFATHPVHTEAVCGIVGRADLLATVFFLLSFLGYVRSTRYPGALGGFIGCSWLIVSVVLSAIAMLCKEHGVTVLGFNIVYEILVVQKLDIRIFLKSRRIVLRWEQLIRGFVLIVSAAGLCLLRCYLMDFRSPTFQRGDNPASFEEDALVRTLSLLYVGCLNLWLLLCPDWLCFDWSMGCLPVIRHICDWRAVFVLSCFLSLGFVFASAVLQRQLSSQRELLLSLALMLIPFLPASNLLFKVGFVIAERILYIPSAGFCLLVAIGLERIFSKKDMMFPFGLLLLVFLIKSHLRSLEWRSESQLFTSALRVCPNNAKVRYNVAKSAADRGHVDLAIDEYRQAIRLYPEYDEALNNLANLLKSRGDLSEAELLLRRALKVRPDFPAAWMNLGIVLASLKRYTEAEKCYLYALKLRKHYPDCYYNIGNLYLEQNRLDEAEKAWINASRLKPTMTVAWNNLIMVKDNHGNHTGAIAIALQALQVAGEAASFHFNLANAYGKISEYVAAETHFKKAVALEPQNALYHVNLGVLYHRWNKLEQAEEAYLTALRINPRLSSAKQNYNMLKKKIGRRKTGETDIN